MSKRMRAICGGRPPLFFNKEEKVIGLIRLSDSITFVGPKGQINSPPFLDILY